MIKAAKLEWKGGGGKEQGWSRSKGKKDRNRVGQEDEQGRSERSTEVGV